MSHNPEVAGSNPAPAIGKGAGNGAFAVYKGKPRPQNFCPTFARQRSDCEASGEGTLKHPAIPAYRAA
jgi:hypothetical protein